MRLPAPVWDGAGHEAVPYGYENVRPNAEPSWPYDPASQAPAATYPAASYGAADVLPPLPRGPLAMIASGLLGFLSLGAR